jgi:hypothetical protein
MNTIPESCQLTVEQLDRIAQIREKVQADVDGIEDLVMKLRDLLTERMLVPSLQEVADILGTGIWGANGTVTTCASYDGYYDVVRNICGNVSDHWHGEVIPAGSEGHAYVQDPDRPRQDYCRVCGRTQGKHTAQADPWTT